MPYDADHYFVELCSRGMPPVLLSKSDDCSIRHDRPTFHTFEGLHVGSASTAFESFKRMAPAAVPDAFLQKRYDDVPPGASREDYEYAAKLATSDFVYRSHMADRYEIMRTGGASKRNAATRVAHERRAGAEENTDGNDRSKGGDDPLLPAMD